MNDRKVVRIIGTGHSLPPQLMNESLVKFCNLPPHVTPEWIRSRIGIESRHTSRRFPLLESDPGPEEGFSNSDLAADAMQKALLMAGVDKMEVDLVILSTCTPDYPVPSTSSLVIDKLKIPKCAVIDIRSACCGTIQGTITAMQYLKTGYYNTIVVIGSDVGTVFGNLDSHSKTYDMHGKTDTVNAIMIGDGAAAIVLRAYDKDNTSAPGIEILHTVMNCIGMDKEFGMFLPGGGSNHPGCQHMLDLGLQHFKHEYRAVLEHGPQLYFEAVAETLRATNITYQEIDLWIPHQANGKVKELATQFKLDPNRVYFNFDRIGNTANPSTFICLDEVVDKDELEDGSLVLIMNAESTKWLYGSLLLRWKSIKKNPSKETKKIPKRKKPNFVMQLLAHLLLMIITWIFWVKDVAQPQTRRPKRS